MRPIAWPERRCDGKVIGTVGERNAAQSREQKPGEEGARKPAEKNEAGAKVRPKFEFAARVMLPAEDDEKRFRADDAAEHECPHCRPEFVFTQAHGTMMAFEPGDGDDAP